MSARGLPTRATGAVIATPRFSTNKETTMRFADYEMKALELAAYAALALWAIGAAVFAAMLV